MKEETEHDALCVESTLLLVCSIGEVQRRQWLFCLAALPGKGLGGNSGPSFESKFHKKHVNMQRAHRKIEKLIQHFVVILPFTFQRVVSLFLGCSGRYQETEASIDMPH